MEGWLKFERIFDGVVLNSHQKQRKNNEKTILHINNKSLSGSADLDFETMSGLRICQPPLGKTIYGEYPEK